MLIFFLPKSLFVLLIFLSLQSLAIDANTFDFPKTIQDKIARKSYLDIRYGLLEFIQHTNGKHYTSACFTLANYYYESRKGIPKNKKKAKRYYDQALKASFAKANEGNAEYQYIVAICTRRAKHNFKQAYEWLVKSAMQGYAPAQAKLAFWYMKGLGVDKPDIEKAAQWAQKASQQENMLGRALLGAYYMNVKKDILRGVKMIQESANAGNAGGQYMLYRCMYYGKGVKKDRAKALQLLQQAANQGLDDAVTKLRIINERKAAAKAKN